MIVRKDDGAFNQDTPSSVWVFDVPLDHKFPHVIGSFSNDGKTEYNMDSVEIVNGVITIRFGIDQYVGVLKYSYEIESTGGDTEITGATTVSVIQNNGNCDTKSLTYYFTNQSEVTVSSDEVKFGFVEVVRGDKYIPLVVNPVHTEQGIKFTFNQAESGRIF